MNIGIDLDHTLAYFTIPFWEAAYELCGRAEKPKPPAHFGVADYPEDVQEMCIKLFSSRWYMADLLESYIDSYYFLLMANSRGHTIQIITCRPESVRNATKDKIRNIYGPHIQCLHFVDKSEHKAQLFGDLKLDMWIDDHPVMCTIAASQGIKTYMRLQPWNKFAYHLQPNLIKTLRDVVRLEFINGKTE